ncbi:hypothetical protein N7448_006149 [Penicillium atrosanguineum]|uniref:Uncharacterized protein n=1 Tax=Penicillium atrosanguineum TaxID=1132637 RepID=A0A9W9L275_9EURO|nr:hypothetical protein N7448_006149 [Penicillium atrosanguineum]KAJ5307477.1 hypothetical protein N7476_008133 [Penicillium atrosanguineum]
MQLKQLEPSETLQSREDQFNKRQHVNVYSAAVIFFITLSSAAYGYAGSVIATTLTQPSFITHMELDTATNAESIEGAMNALFYTGGVFGSFFAGWSSKKFGRKFSTGFGNALLVISGACMTASINPTMFIAFRFVSGFGSMVIVASVPIWVAELVPPRLRGLLTDVHAVMMMVGYTLACYVGLGFYFVKGSSQWRGPIALQMALPVIILSGLYWMPESPRYLLSTDRHEEARDIIFRMHSSPLDPEHEFARREFFQMKKQILLDAGFATSYWSLLKKSSMRKRLAMTVFLEFVLMSSGILVILNYGSIIWKSLGFDTVQILNFQCGFQLAGFVFNVIAMTFVDRVRRPWLIAGGLLGCGALVGILTALQSFYLGTENRAGLGACVAVIFLFQATFSLTLDGPTYFYIAEIWPSHVRSQGFAIAMAVLSATNLMWLQATPYAISTISWRWYLVFTCIPGTAAVLVIIWFKDTRNKPLEEIAGMFGDDDMVAVYQRELNNGGLYDADEVGNYSKNSNGLSVEMMEEA